MALARERTQKTKGRCQSQTIRFCRGDKTAKLEGMLKIMCSFQNFSNQQVIRFVPSHLPVATMAASPAPKKQKRASKLLVVTKQCGPGNWPSIFHALKHPTEHLFRCPKALGAGPGDQRL
jgi:hypothetical protein